MLSCVAPSSALKVDLAGPLYSGGLDIGADDMVFGLGNRNPTGCGVTSFVPINIKLGYLQSIARPPTDNFRTLSGICFWVHGTL